MALQFTALMHVAILQNMSLAAPVCMQYGNVSTHVESTPAMLKYSVTNSSDNCSKLVTSLSQTYLNSFINQTSASPSSDQHPNKRSYLVVALLSSILLFVIDQKMMYGSEF